MAALESSPPSSGNDLRLSQSKIPAAKVLVGPLSRRVQDLVSQQEKEGTAQENKKRRLSNAEANSFSMEMTPSSSFKFSRAWVQGVVVARDLDQSAMTVDSFTLDDSTGTIAVDIRMILKNLRRRKIDYKPPEVGDYVMAVGKVVPPFDEISELTLKAHKVLVIEDPNREALWNAETLQLFRRFQR